jgi:hypothetical protein
MTSLSQARPRDTQAPVSRTERSEFLGCEPGGPFRLPPPAARTPLASYDALSGSSAQTPLASYHGFVEPGPVN